MADTTDNQTQDEWNEETVYGPSTVIAALDQIEDLVESSRAVPLSASIMVNKAEILDLLDQAREALPEDLVAADAVVADADAVLGRADSAAETRIAEANSRASSTLDRPTSAPLRSSPTLRKKPSAPVRAQTTRPPRSSRRPARTPGPRLPTRTPRRPASSPPRTSCAWPRIAPARSSPRPSARQHPCVKAPTTTWPPRWTSLPTSSPTSRVAPTLDVARSRNVAASTSPMWI